MGEGRVLAEWEVAVEALGIQLERVGVAPWLFASLVSYSNGSWQTIIGGGSNEIRSRVSYRYSKSGITSRSEGCSMQI